MKEFILKKTNEPFLKEGGQAPKEFNNTSTLSAKGLDRTSTLSNFQF